MVRRDIRDCGGVATSKELLAKRGLQMPHAIPIRFILLTVLFGGVVGCGGDGKKGQGSDGFQREVRVAAAADLQFAFGEVLSAFQKRNPGIKVSGTFGSSGTFFAQLINK